MKSFIAAMLATALSSRAYQGDVIAVSPRSEDYPRINRADPARYRAPKKTPKPGDKLARMAAEGRAGLRNHTGTFGQNIRAAASKARATPARLARHVEYMNDQRFKRESLRPPKFAAV